MSEYENVHESCAKDPEFAKCCLGGCYERMQTQDRIRTLERERDEAIAEQTEALRLCGKTMDMRDALAHRSNVLREALEAADQADHSLTECTPHCHGCWTYEDAKKHRIAPALALTPTQAEREVAAMKKVCEHMQAWLESETKFMDAGAVVDALRELEATKESE